MRCPYFYVLNAVLFITVIYNEGQWTLYKVSPLNHLQYDRVKLKQYASKIRQALVCNVSAKSSLQYAVQFDPLPLKYSEDDFDALRVSCYMNYCCHINVVKLDIA